MKTVTVEKLSTEAFLPFGFYANHINPTGERLGAVPVEFFRDMVQQNLSGAGVVSFSTCRVEKRKLCIDISEYHSHTGEGILPLDQDILLHVGPATPGNSGVPVEKIRVFLAPRGTMVVLRPGVWHHAPFTTTTEPANVLIVLPERTYANDCIVVELPAKDRIEIRMQK